MHASIQTRTAVLLGVAVLLLLISALTPPAVGQEGGERLIGDRVIVARIDGVIDRALEEMVNDVITSAEREGSLVVFEINTPGGLLESAMNIGIRIDTARVPVVVFVVEKWAESAGSLILVTSHVAAMQPGTIIGSMQPIQYDPTTGNYRPVNESKIINPILKFLEERAGNKGRNVTAIKLFVTENLNLGAREALEMGVIDYVATDLNDLLRQMNGTTIKMPYTGEVFLLRTDRASIERYEPQLRIRIAHALSDPMLTSLFMTLGITIILFSLLSGHLAITPVGILLLLLGMIGSGYSLNMTTLFLLVMGIVLIAVEMFVTPGFGIVGATGIVMLALGIALLPVSGGYNFSPQYARQFLYAAYGTGAILGSLTAVAVYKVIQVRKKKPFTWDPRGKTGKAVDDLEPDGEGFVFLEGEYWRARAKDTQIPKGSRVRVVDKEGPVLIVEPLDERERSSVTGGGEEPQGQPP